MNSSSWCLCLLQQPDLAVLGISWQSRAVLSRSSWAGNFSLLCCTSCTVTHTLWVELMDAFFLCLLLTLVPGGFSQAVQQPGRGCSRVCSIAGGFSSLALLLQA